MPRNARASALPKMRDLRARYHNGSVPIEAVGLKLFTGIENFEIMAIPFSSSPAIFLRWGRATSMIDLSVAVRLGINPVHFGILIVVDMEVGIVPPAGRPQPLRRFRDYQDGYHGAYDRGVAVVDDYAGRSSSSSPHVPQISLWLPRALGML